MKFKTSFLKRELDLPSSALVDDIIDTSRWSTHHKIIFEHEGKFYQTEYSRGSTEQQDERPWEYEEEVDCDEVELKEVKVMRWVKKTS